ncbi:hypothetical protein H6A60_04025 [Sutterella massiliensis]|uniref:FAD-dependent oxidoreductase 2 FAD binding domain-containing protein n=1 Tax=Sutterella massiliensis TaxID=1816689 RepID=A0ABS2DQN8_9BURK|nr:hypothetical protein [Sutterella massiliensis]MBM6703656.1 hypothetical protein [Sutterella massiliensis]
MYWANAQKGAVIREAPDKSRVLGVEVETKNGKEYWAEKKGVVAATGVFTPTVSVFQSSGARSRCRLNQSATCE